VHSLSGKWIAVAAAVCLTGAPALAEKVSKKPDPELKKQDDILVEGLSYLGAHSPAEAIARFDKVIAWYENKYANAKEHLYCAHSHLEMLLYLLEEAAEKHDATVLEPTWCDAIYFKGFALIDLGLREEAKPWLERALKMAPKNSRYLGEMAEYKKMDHDWEGALETFAQAAEAAELVDEKDRLIPLSRAWRGMGFSLVELGRLDEAEAIFRRCLEKNASDRVAQSELAYIAQQRAKTTTPIR
jgi:tetratricopeptide (TPR) repeat protein